MPAFALIRRSLIMMVLALTPWLAPAQTRTPLPPELDGAVTTLVGLLSDGQALENRDARRLHTVSLFGNSARDALVLFTLENFSGGSDYRHYLAVFERVDADEAAPDRVRYRLVGSVQVGGLRWREVDFAEVRYARGRIELATREYQKKDPVCCPSRPGKAVYLLRNFNLAELRGRR